LRDYNTTSSDTSHAEKYSRFGARVSFRLSPCILIWATLKQATPSSRKGLRGVDVESCALTYLFERQSLGVLLAQLAQANWASLILPATIGSLSAFVLSQASSATPARRVRRLTILRTGRSPGSDRVHQARDTVFLVPRAVDRYMLSRSSEARSLRRVKRSA
jgi:hypothetical protein